MNRFWIKTWRHRGWFWFGIGVISSARIVSDKSNYYDWIQQLWCNHAKKTNTNSEFKNIQKISKNLKIISCMRRISSKCWTVNANHRKNVELESGLGSGSTILRCMTSKSGRRHRSSHFAWRKSKWWPLCQTSRVSHFKGPCQIMSNPKIWVVYNDSVRWPEIDSMPLLLLGSGLAPPGGRIAHGGETNARHWHETTRWLNA